MVESRCGAVSVGRTYLFPPLSSGGALVVQPWLRFHIPLIEPDVQISRIRLSDKTSRLCFRVQRHLQFLNTFRSLIGCPISMSFTTYCVCLELRPLPSTGITRLQRYYEPLRHPRAPGLSLTGFRLVVAPATPWGFPCCVRFPCVHAVATTPAQRLGVLFRSFTQSCQPSPKGLSGRPAHRPFRGLLGVHSRYGLHTRAVTVYRDTLTRGFSHFVTSMTAPVASGWSGCRVGLTPTGKRRLSTAHTRSGHGTGGVAERADMEYR